MAEQTQSRSAVIQLRVAPKEEKKLGDALWRRALRHLRRDKLTLIAMTVIVMMSLLAVFAPPITTHILKVDPEATNPAIRLQLPLTPGHILGTDNLGRDYLARLLYGGRISLAIGFSGAIVTFGIGIVLGLITGYFGGAVDDIMNAIIVTLDSVPGLYLLILLSTLFRPGPEALVMLLALTGWTGVTRVIRGQTISLRNLEYVVGARAIGASSWRIMFQHMLPNTLSIILVSLAGSVAGLILAESTLSFLNLGVQPPIPTWGNMLTNAQQFFRGGPHLAIISGLLIFITVLCLFLVGDGLRDAFDPRTTS